MESCTNWLEPAKCIDSTIVDFQKEFDSVSHTRARFYQNGSNTVQADKLPARLDTS